MSADVVISQLVDEDADVFGIVDRRADEMDAALLESGVKGRRQVLRSLDPAALHAMRRCEGDEVGIGEAEAEIGVAVDGLLPADHAVGVVLQDTHDPYELEA